MPLITLLTDFGLGRYVAAMKGVILTINPEATVVDLHHNIRPQSVLEGAFVLASAVPYYPGAIHVGVVDPGVGTARRPIVVVGERGLLVGPDNGLLYPAAERIGRVAVYEITNREYVGPRVSKTFHGRDLFAPAAAHLSRGVDPALLGPVVEDLVPLDFGRPEIQPGEIRARILHADHFGNLITNVPGDAVPSWVTDGGPLEVGNTMPIPATFHDTYAAAERDRPLLTISSDGYLEVAVNQGNAAERLHVAPGDLLTLRPRKG